MPLKKYYHPILPMDLNNLIGKFAGFGRKKLVFTLTNRRHFLGKIYIWSSHSSRSIQLRRLDQWTAIRLLRPGSSRVIIGELTKSLFISVGHYMNQYVDDLFGKIAQLSEILDYHL